jgi:N-acetylglucosaminyldiphosphoundecaprenol N-acetyl-beta-D-mannosaminyltransferase
MTPQAPLPVSPLPVSPLPVSPLPVSPLPPLPPLATVPFGRIHAHHVTFDGAIDRIVALCRARQGGYVLTPNVDHVVMADTDEALRQAYADAALSLVDGKPLVWLSRALGTPLPAKISGSDLLRPLVARAAREGLSVYFLGGQEGIAARAAAILQAEHPALVVAGVDAPPFGFDKDPAQDAAVVARVQAAKPALLFVALGAPKQELWLARHKEALVPAVGLGIGASLDFIAGVVKRAPRVVSEAGFEWAWRLAQEPRRMAQRYLVRDRAFPAIAWRTWRQARARDHG